MKKEDIKKFTELFDKIRQESDGETEFWYARDLQKTLGYEDWRNFLAVVGKAKLACEASKYEVSDHFVEVNKMVAIGLNTERSVDDIMMSRYACYLIAQNGDPKKDEIAFAQTYFAIQTRKQELLEERLALQERLTARKKLTKTEKELSGNLYQRGVDDQGFARIRAKGDTALFGGFNTSEMKDRLGITSSRALADFLPTITIKAKDFAAEITNFNTKKEGMFGETKISNEHIKNNKEVRQTLIRTGIYPEKLPAETDLKKIERKLTSENKKLGKNKVKKTKLGG
ncbi:MAG: DNA damage-inducible protein D [Alphaproteobacteria bacterium RIFCSPLOWO2_01_FULL_40_26]|nr:MAG: DNA damage-inducible protein D [Alphaproteobacteria bacterium RIFCSPHIGHO2_02_FULL_40_34]OFW86937.1 MAG: DNA damage-inducible protein D [Alphaproteobacteria bacterium RIFCSPHIGHO2_01_FULL_40_8]OFW94447.1 MAG: DNA damage-inducible protein D [Alphaproteobacteria bacterium RIFCSPLOWO2_01_FULL_40_26]OFX09517.1 MAG: DNA damage-inducible protein D [Alphaproteobacteria bacterium RIFCSPLOWO2_02_FULL_40_19]OFX10667.1 MAG: DNA damage-inducible protein D [Alphaproteobacteria bacterium RIFCSPLOWO2_